MEKLNTGKLWFLEGHTAMWGTVQAGRVQGVEHQSAWLTESASFVDMWRMALHRKASMERLQLRQLLG